MKATRMLLALFAMIVVAACNEADNVTSPDPNSAPAWDESTATDTTTSRDGLGGFGSGG